MATITVSATCNYDLCSGQTTAATIDVFNIGNGKFTVDTDTKFCSGHTTTATASNGSLDTVTIASTAIDGELKLDGTSVWIIPIKGGSGTAPVPIATALVPTIATFDPALNYVTLTFAGAHGYVAGDRIGVGSIVGSELVNGYNGVFTIIDAPLTTTLRYAVVEDPGTSTITNGKVIKYYKCSQTQTRTATTGTSWAAGIASYTTTVAHTFIAGNSVVITGASPAGYNGTYTIVSAPTTTTFTVAMVGDPGAWVSGGTITKTVSSTYLGAWSSFTAGPTTATIPATGWLKVKDLVNGPFEEMVALTIQGGTTPVAMAIDHESRGWIEVVGGELSTTPATYTIPRLGKFTVAGDWFYPKTPTQFNISAATWATNVSTYTTAAVHGLTIGSIVTIAGANAPGWNGTYTVVTLPTTSQFTVAQLVNPVTAYTTLTAWGWGELTTNGVAQQTIQLPASGGVTVGTTSYAGVWVETAQNSGVYSWWPCVGNATATASMFLTGANRNKVCYMGAAGLLRFGGDGTNAWGLLPAAGCRIRIPNIISVNALKVVTTGCFIQTIPNATITSRPKFVTTSAGVISVDKWQSSWYPIWQQPYSVNLSYMAQCESMLVSEIAQSVTWNEVHMSMSVVASANQQYALNMATCYAGGNITDSTFSKYHNGTSGYYPLIATDLQGFNFTGCAFDTLMTTAVGGATARNASTGAMSITRVADSTFTNTTLIGGKTLHTTNTNLTFTNTTYIDSRNVATTTTTPQNIHSFNTNTAFVTIDGITFGGATNVHPYTGIVEVLSASNNIKVRNIGTNYSRLSLGSASATGVLWTGATGGAGYNLEFKRIYCTLARTGIVATADNSYNNITYESVKMGDALTFTNSQLNVVTKGLGATNATTGQTSVYGHAWQDYFTPVGATLAAGTAWATDVTTYTTSAAHNLIAGDTVTISGVIASIYDPIDGYNGTYTVLASGLTSTVFKVTKVGNPGTWTSGGTTNPLLGKVVLQMNEQTSATPSYTFNKAGPGSGFTSTGILVLLNLDDTITWETPYYVLGHKRFTYGAVAPYTIAQPTFTSVNPNNHNWFYDIDKGAGYTGTYKNLHFKTARAGASWAIASTALTLTPVTATCVGSISGSTMTVTSVSAGYLYEGMTVTGTGVTAGTVITAVLDSITGKAGLYTVGIMTFAAGTYTIGTSTQTVTSTTLTASTSCYGMTVGNTLYDITTAGNIPTGTTVTALNSATSVTMSGAGTTASSQLLAVSAIHAETGIVAATGVKLKIRARVHVVATTNALTAVALPTVTDGLYQQTQYPLDTVATTIVLENIIVGSRYRIYNSATDVLMFEGTAAASTVTINYTWNANVNVRIRVRKSSTLPKYQAFETNGTVTSSGLSAYVSQVLDPVAT